MRGIEKGREEGKSKKGKRQNTGYRSQETRESGGKQQWNIEYRTRNVQCRSATWWLCAFVALVIDHWLLTIDYCSSSW